MSRIGTIALVAALAVLANAQFELKYHMASKTAYYPLQSFEDHTPAPAGCTPRHVNLVARHGTRNPGDGDIEFFDELEAKIAFYAEDINPDHAWMLSYRNPFEMANEGKLLPIGRQEHYEMAQRFKKAYPTVFNHSYDSDRFAFRGTQEQRAGLSASSFGFGLFEGEGTLGESKFEPVFVLSDTTEQDNILQYYENCDLYVEMVDNNDTANLETEIYMSMILPDIAADLTRALTVNGAWQVTEDEAFGIYAACQFDATIFDKTDEWCSFFTQQQIEDFEYAEDLDDYYTKSYPYEINYRMTSELIKDVVFAMQDAQANETPQKASLRFAHSSTVVPLFAAFGLFRDEPLLRADSSASAIAARQFRTSILSPMGTNFAFVLYDCGEETDALVKVLHNEMEITVAGCSDIYCPLQQFVSAYESYVSADFEEVCAFP